MSHPRERPVKTLAPDAQRVQIDDTDLTLTATFRVMGYCPNNFTATLPGQFRSTST